MHEPLPAPDERDQAVARAIATNFEFSGRRFERGQYVAILDGSVVAVEDSAEAALHALRDVAPERWRGLVCQVIEPELDVIRR
jgi:hypothetical protein